MPTVTVDDADTEQISYSTNWVGYRGQQGNIDASQWFGSTFHACRAEPISASRPCWANMTLLTGATSISIFSEHSNLQGRYWCALLNNDDNDNDYNGAEGDVYKWFNGSSLTTDESNADAPFTWSLNRTRCSVTGLDPNRKHVVALGQLAQDTQGIGITLDYYVIDSAGSNDSVVDAAPTWSSDFVSASPPANLGWGTPADTSSSSSSSSSSPTGSQSPQETSSSEPSPSSASQGGGVSKTAATGIGLGVGLGGLALLLVSGAAFALWRRQRSSLSSRSSAAGTSVVAPTEKTYHGGGPSVVSVGGDSPITRSSTSGRRARYPSTSQSFLTSYHHQPDGNMSEHYGRGGGVPEVQNDLKDQTVASSPATTSTTRGFFLANPSTFRER